MRLVQRLWGIIKDWIFVVRRDGIRSALPQIGLEIARLPYQNQSFHVIGVLLDEPLPDYEPSIMLDIRSFEKADLDSVRKINKPSEANYCAKRIADGQKGLVALYQGQLAGYAWGCANLNPKLDMVHQKFEPGDVLCMDVYTAPIFRGKGVQTALTLARFRLFRDLGYKRAICNIDRNNAPSLAVWQRKFSGLTIGRIDYIRIGPWHKVRSK